MRSVKNTKLILWEVVLLGSSILVFRSVWLFLDQMAWSSGAAGLTLLLAAGLALTFLALRMLHKEK